MALFGEVEYIFQQKNEIPVEDAFANYLLTCIAENGMSINLYLIIVAFCCYSYLLAS